MKTHEITTSKGKFVVVDGTYGVSTSRCGIDFKDEKGRLHVTLGSYKLLFKLSEATEEDAKLVVTAHESESINTHLMELHYLLKSKGIDINNGNWYLFKKI